MAGRWSAMTFTGMKSRYRGRHCRQAEIASKVGIAVAGYETCSYGIVDFNDYIQARPCISCSPMFAWREA